MSNLREIFHEIGNWHNKISIVAGVTRDILTGEDIDALSKDEIKEKITKMVDGFKKIEDYVINTDKTMSHLKAFVYKQLDPDAECKAD